MVAVTGGIARRCRHPRERGGDARWRHRTAEARGSDHRRALGRSEHEGHGLSAVRARGGAALMASAGWGRIINVSGLAARQSGSTIGSIRNVAGRGHDQEPRRRARAAGHQRDSGASRCHPHRAHDRRRTRGTRRGTRSVGSSKPTKWPTSSRSSRHRRVRRSPATRSRAVAAPRRHSLLSTAPDGSGPAQMSNDPPPSHASSTGCRWRSTSSSRTPPALRWCTKPNGSMSPSTPAASSG